MSIRTLGDGSVPVVPADIPERPPENELTRMLAARGTVRAFGPREVSDAWVDEIVRHGMRAPTSSNMQAYSVVVVRDADKRQRLARVAGGQQHVADCAVVVVVCADLSRIEHACSVHGVAYEGRSLEAGLVASLDAALLGITMSYVAESFGLGSVLIGALRNDAVEVARILGLPARCFAVFGICLGWPSVRPLPKPRTPASGVVHHDAYDARGREAAIDQYDRELAAYYRARGVDTPDRAWSQVIAGRLGRDPRKNLRAQLCALGFPLE
jgi:nitroreductase